MRKNLSEELEINDDVVLNDGEEKKPEEEKEGDKLKKEIQKQLDDKSKAFDEIRDAEAPKAEVNDGMGKSTKIKHFVEKLTLEEPSDVLNEDVIPSDDEDRYYDLYFDLINNVYHQLVEFAHKALDNSYVREQGIPIDFVKEQAESACEEALMHFDDEA